MKFRRTLSKGEHNKIRIKAIIITIAFFLVIFLMIYTYSYVSAPFNYKYINVKMLNKNTYVIDNDTTNYDKFASLLKKRVIEQKMIFEEHNLKIFLLIDKDCDTKDITKSIQIVDAMNLPFEISSNYSN